MTLKRRALLTGSGLVVSSLAGCSRVFDDGGSDVTLQFYNYTPDTQWLEVQALREDKDEYSEAHVLRQEFEIPPREEGDIGGLRESDILERNRYLFRVLFKHGTDELFTHHYYPGEEGGGFLTIRIYGEEDTDEKYIRFG